MLSRWFVGEQSLRYLVQDESRLGRKTETGRVITAPGVKPRVPTSWERENYWLYGAVEPESGWSVLQEQPRLNQECFQQFLEEVSAALGEEVAVMQVDGAPAHVSTKVRWPENIIPLRQPPHSPELNPAERVWEHLKQELKGERFGSLSELKERVNEVVASLTREALASLTGYDFILDAVFYANSH